MEALRKILQGHADVAMVALVIGVLFILFAPIPAPLLDFLILANVSFALLILLLTFYMGKPVEFSTFPSILLVATLFRLALNISATRLILRDGEAGRVIGAIGNYVVGGNYVIGIIVFLILVVVQFVVVTNGAQRVSEVAARFTLDSMPGQQMSIDADLNMGFIDQEEAQRRRKNISKEAAFYGAMDGASKFVKGDAIAGIIIMLINCIGGLVIGVMQLGMRWDQAIKNFTLLTIGDGIVTQVPALIISVGTGLIVTRSASDANLGVEAFKQITAYSKTLWLVVAALCGLVFLPGIPAWPIVILVLFYLGLLYVRRTVLSQDSGTDEAAAAETKTAAPEKQQEAYEALQVEAIEVMLGIGLVPMLNSQSEQFAERINAFRKQYAFESGLVIPNVRFREGAKSEVKAYEVLIHGVQVAKSTLEFNHLLALKSAKVVDEIEGLETRDPSYGMPAVWIETEQKQEAQALGYSVIDPATVFLTHLFEALKQHAASLLSRNETEKLLKRIRDAQPGLIEEIVPTVLSIGDIQKVLQNLLREKVSIRNLDIIIEVIADQARISKDGVYLTEMVRQKLGPIICQGISKDGKSLDVLTLAPEVEQNLAATIRAMETGEASPVEPRYTEKLVMQIAQYAEKMIKAGTAPVVLCAPELRRHIKLLSERMVPQLRVVSLAEVPNHIDVRAYANVKLN